MNPERFSTDNFSMSEYREMVERLIRLKSPNAAHNNRPDHAKFVYQSMFRKAQKDIYLYAKHEEALFLTDLDVIDTLVARSVQGVDVHIVLDERAHERVGAQDYFLPLKPLCSKTSETYGAVQDFCVADAEIVRLTGKHEDGQTVSYFVGSSRESAQTLINFCKRVCEPSHKTVVKSTGRTPECDKSKVRK